MLKFIKIGVNGYKMLEPNFEIDLLNKERVYSQDLNTEVFSIDASLYSFKTFAFVGSNSSGKTTLLNLIYKISLFFKTGRWTYEKKEFYKTDSLSLKIMFYLDGNIYQYENEILKNDSFDDKNNQYCKITNEKLKQLKYAKTKGIKNIEQFENNAEDITIEHLSNSFDDTSAIVKLTSSHINVDEFYTNSILNFQGGIYRETFFKSLKNCNRKLATSIIKLLDDSIEYINCDKDDIVTLKRFNENEEVLLYMELISILSSGTVRGVELFIRALKILEKGGIFIVDEIENCFQKNLVDNLLFLFNDSSINKNNAQLFFSTHYIEVLDTIERRDNIFIMHKENASINIKNLYSYKIRTELMKSKQFQNNVFGTLLNYQAMMEVRRNILDELRINND